MIGTRGKPTTYYYYSLKGTWKSNDSWWHVTIARSWSSFSLWVLTWEYSSFKGAMAILFHLLSQVEFVLFNITISYRLGALSIQHLFSCILTAKSKTKIQAGLLSSQQLSYWPLEGYHSQRSNCNLADCFCIVFVIKTPVD